MVSLIPYFCYWPIIEYGEDNSFWVYLYYLKVVRLIFSRSISYSIDTIFNQTGVYDQNLAKRFINYIQMAVVYIKFMLQLHSLTCTWILIGRMKESSWYNLNIDNTGGWITRNEEYYGELSYFEIYVHALNIITETISKVGYGMENSPI